MVVSLTKSHEFHGKLMVLLSKSMVFNDFLLDPYFAYKINDFHDKLMLLLNKSMVFNGFALYPYLFRLQNHMIFIRNL